LGEHHHGYDWGEHHHGYDWGEHHHGSAERNLAVQNLHGSNSVVSIGHHRDVVRCRANHCAREMDGPYLACQNLACQNLGDQNLGARVDHRRGAGVLDDLNLSDLRSDELGGRRRDVGGPGDHHRGVDGRRLPRHLKDADHPCGDRLNAVRLSATHLDGRD